MEKLIPVNRTFQWLLSQLANLIIKDEKMNKMRSLLFTIIFAALASSCTEDKPTFTSLLSATGYRYETDMCRLVGESELTSKYLDDSSDLVACPDDITLIGNIEGAEEVLTVDNYRVFTVPVIQPVYD